MKYSYIIITSSLLLSACGGGGEQPKTPSDPADIAAPVISLVGDNPQQLTKGQGYTELGATASDNIDGNLTANILVDSTSVNNQVVGNYTVSYTVADAAGNTMVSNRVVNVVAAQVSDTIAPVISLVGDNPQQLIQGQDYTELGATASDNVDGNLTVNIVVDSTSVNNQVVDNYTVSYTVADAAGNTVVSNRVVNVATAQVADTIAPVISLVGDNPQQLTKGQSYTELGATASDNVDGNISASIVIDSSNVDSSTVGSYTVNYTVADAASNTVVSNRVVNVVATQVADTTAPVISLVGDNPQQLMQGQSYTELGATASDNVDGNISANIVIDSSNVDMSTVGSYTVNYTVADAAGNTAVSNRVVNVIADTTAPLISLVGDNPQQLIQGQGYTELGATASDNVGGNLTASIVIDSTLVNNQVAGNYTVTYTVADAADNTTVLNRVVNVVEPAEEVIGLSDLSYVSSGAAEYSQLAINSNDITYVIFQDKTASERTRVKKEENGSWVNVGDNNGLLSTQSASHQQLVIDGNDNVFSAYIENNQVVIKQLVSDVWQSYSVPVIAGNVDTIQFEVDSDDVLYMLYSQGDVHTLVNYQSNTWQAVGVDSFNAGKVGSFYNIDFSPYSTSSILLTYRNQDDTNKVSRTILFNGTSWQSTSGVGSGLSIKLAVNSSGDFYAFKVLFSNTFGAASIYQLTATSWSIIGEQGFNHSLTEHGINEGGTPLYTDIVVNDNGDVHVAYTDPQTINSIAEQRTVVARYSSGEWQQLLGSEIAPVTNAKTRFNSMVLNSDNKLQITFIDDGFDHSGKAIVLKESALLDTDNDGIPDVSDPDDDNDGYNDNEDYKPLDKNVWIFPFDLTNELASVTAGDTIVIPGGTYSDAIIFANSLPRGTALEPITIIGEQDVNGNNLVMFDGTKNINDLAGGQWQLVDGIWQRQLSAQSKVWQLFIKQTDDFSKSNYSQMVPARWPNAKFTDGSIYKRSAWAKVTDNGHNPLRGTNAATDFNGTSDELTTECLSEFADEVAGWDLHNLGAEQRTWLLAQTYTADNQTLKKCVGVSTDDQKSYEVAGEGTLTHDLSAQTFDATGAMAVLNYGHWRTWTRPVVEHTPGSAEFSHVFLPEYHAKNQYYFFDSALSLLDSEEEWYFDKNTQMLYFKTPGNIDPNNIEIRAKVQSYSFEMNAAHHVIFKDVNFFASTLKCDWCSNITIDNANFAYGGSAKRMLKEWATVRYQGSVVKLTDATPDNIYISSSNGYEVNSPDNYNSIGNRFINSSVTNTDSPALHFNGKDSVVSNNHFENIDYTCSEGWSHQAAVNTFMGFDTDFTYNTLINTACSQALRGREGSDIRHNYIRNAGWAQTDGALLGGGHSMAAAYNWTIEHKESGLRYDAAWPPTAISHWGTDSYAHHNVTIHNRGMVFKGWKQRVYNNTLVDLDYIDPITQVAGSIIPRLSFHNDVRLTQNGNDSGSDIYQCVGVTCGAGIGTLYANNLSALILGNVGNRVYRYTANNTPLNIVGGPILATGTSNFETNPLLSTTQINDQLGGLDISEQNLVQKLLRDPLNYDFRPKLSSAALIGTGSDIDADFAKTEQYSDYSGLPEGVDYIGAYAASANYYPIPGKRELVASHPIPLDNQQNENSDIKAKIDTDLMWRVAQEYDCDTVAYEIYFEGALVGTYTSAQNIHFLTGVTLVSGQNYQWRVDVDRNGSIVTGDTWQFTVE